MSTNSSSMNMRPKAAAANELLEDPDEEQAGCMLTLPAKDFARLVNYPVIVEMWTKKLYGRLKRRWLAEFTEAEREQITRQYRRFSSWHLITGTPRTVLVKASLIPLLQRAVDFFATA